AARMSSKALALFWLRIFMGMNYFFHGVPRLATGLSDFAAKTAAGFEGTLLPPALALPFGYAIPVAELILGLLLILGIRKRDVLQGAFALMALLTAGICLQQKWAVAG